MRTRDAWGDTGARLWTVSEFARQYILTRDSQVASERLRLSNEYNALIAARDNARASSNGLAFRATFINATTTDEATVVRSLAEAQRASKRGDYQAAAQFIDTAKRLLPSFYEVWRVSAQVHDAAGDVIGADQDFQQAIELSDGHSEPLLAHYAAFLARQQSFHEALSLLREPAARPDAAVELIAMFAWMQTLCGNARDAIETFGGIHSDLFELGGRARSQYVTQFVESLRRACELELKRNLPRDALQFAIQGVAVGAQAVSAGMLDERMATTIQECFNEACRAVAVDCSASGWAELVAVTHSLVGAVPLIGRSNAGLEAIQANCPAIGRDAFFQGLAVMLDGGGDSPEIVFGAIKPFPPTRDFAFIAGDDGQDYYLRRYDLRDAAWESVADGGHKVSFRPAPPDFDGGRPRARRARITPRAEEP
jgi:tetratricopeptide (TPR) repeat protein